MTVSSKIFKLYCSYRYLGLDNGLTNGLPLSPSECSAALWFRRWTRDWNNKLHCSHLNLLSPEIRWLACFKWYLSPPRELKSWLQFWAGHITIPFLESSSFRLTKSTLGVKSPESSIEEIVSVKWPYDKEIIQKNWVPPMIVNLVLKMDWYVDNRGRLYGNCVMINSPWSLQLLT